MSDPTVVVVTPGAEPEPEPAPVVVTPEPEPEPESATEAVLVAETISIEQRLAALEAWQQICSAVVTEVAEAQEETEAAVAEIIEEEAEPEPVEIPVPAAPERTEPERRRPGWGARNR